MTTPFFLQGVPTELVLARLAKAGGNEVESGKLANGESSAALAVNTFGWFMPSPNRLPPIPGCPYWKTVERVEIEYCARFPWSGGRHPWLDAMVETAEHLIGIESKRFEPFRDRKAANLSEAYDRPVWGANMGPFEQVRDQLRAHPNQFQMLDAAQLVKHAFGLVTDGRRRKRKPHLHYLFAEPASRSGRPISDEARTLHRQEIGEFATAVAGAEVGFSPCSYREWLMTWKEPDVLGHANRLIDAFSP